MRHPWIWVPVFALAIALPAFAAKKDATKITCEEFASQTPEGRTRITAYLDGYSNRGKKVEDIAAVDVQRELDVIVVACREEPKATLWQKIEKRLPGGKKKIHPVKMTCEEFLSESKDVQTEAAYWLDGYSASEDVHAAGEVDLERDTVVLVEMCKPAPKESLWKRIKSKL